MTTQERPNQYIFDHTINSEREAYASMGMRVRRRGAEYARHKLVMNTGSEPLQDADSASDQRAGHELSPALPQAGGSQSVHQPHGSVSRSEQPSPAAEALQPTPGSNVVRIYGISDCVLAVAFTL
jgi:hypothetical protein